MNQQQFTGGKKESMKSPRSSYGVAGPESPISRNQATELKQEDLSTHLEKSGFTLKKQSLKLDGNHSSYHINDERNKQFYTSPKEKLQKKGIRKSGTMKNEHKDKNKFANQPQIEIDKSI